MILNIIAIIVVCLLVIGIIYAFITDDDFRGWILFVGLLLLCLWSIIKVAIMIFV